MLVISLSIILVACQQSQVSAWSLNRNAMNNGLKRFQSATKSLRTATLTDAGSQLKLDDNVRY